MGSGIDYGRFPMANGMLPNRDQKTGIRYGVIPAHATDGWDERSEPEYEDDGSNEDGDGDLLEPSAWVVNEDGFHAFTGGEGGDIFVTLSPYFTRAKFCSPCAPGACYLLNPNADGERAYCLGHEWFEGPAPYPVYRVDTGEEVKQ